MQGSVKGVTPTLLALQMGVLLYMLPACGKVEAVCRIETAKHSKRMKSWRGNKRQAPQQAG